MVSSHSSGSEADPSARDGFLNGSEILVIESDLTIRALLTNALKPTGAKVRIATSLVDAQQILCHKHPSLILSSIQLVDGDICHMIRNLRQREMLEDHLGKQPGHLPVIGLLPQEAAFDLIAHDQARRTLLDVGMDIVLTQPIVVDRLIRLIKRMLIG